MNGFSVIRQTVLFATIGLAVEFLLLLLMGFVIARPDFLPHFLLSAVGLYLGAATFGSVASTVFCKIDVARSGIYFVGILVALLTLFTQVLLGSSLEYLRHSNESWAFPDYVLKPIFSVFFVGTLPALGLGVLYARRVENLLKYN
jgi:hypothetical protein